ncbi:hypothetical protein [Sulfurimonas sp.]|uniref:hypothetical protein n=1 Tax=Sulfurimonas sp. TaxID=2022749 RepID=UPI0039E567AC
MSVLSIILAILLATFITAFMYIQQGSVTLKTEVYEALFAIFIFWLPLSWSITLLFTLFRSLKYIFNQCNNGYELKLLECNRTEVIEDIGYGDLVKVWRRWFMLIIWLTGTQMIVALGFTYVFSLYSAIFDWFNIYILFCFILVSGYFSFILLAGRCKKVKVVKC